ncbi:MAG: phosphotransferase, partial [Bifidobacterium sp.]
MLAALTSAAMPSIAVAGVRDSEQSNATDESYGIAQAVVQDAAGKLYDVLTCDTDKGRARLRSRVHAAQTLEFAKDPGGLGFGLDRVLAFEPGEDDQSVTGSNAVVVAVHHDGESRLLGLLTLDDCSSVGTAIGAIHRLRPGFLKENRYPVFTTGQIRAQLTSWIKRLQQAGHIPAEITGSWSRILETEGLWSFSTCPVHGGFSDGDFLFSGSAITAVTNWQDMQVNDPARDLAWVFSKLDEGHRNAVISAYGRMLGARLDDLIMLRANLWLQMEQVGEFIQALNAADNMKIMQFKAQVERLAHQLSDVTRHTARPSGVSSGIGRSASEQGPSTITVGTLLGESDRRGAAPRQNSLAGAGAAPTVADVPAGARPDAPENRAWGGGGGGARPPP